MTQSRNKILKAERVIFQGLTLSSFRKRLRRATIATLGVAALLAIVFNRPLFRDNFAVVNAELIRSAQPSDELADWIQDYGIASILNLRGGTPADSWYVKEVEATRSRKAAFFDYPMQATQRPLRRDLLTLIDFMETCPYPLLVHCKHGADRTGLAVAIYRMVRLNESPDIAMRAFSLFFGHIPIAGTQRLHEPFLEYASWLKDRKLTHSPSRFRDWALNDYKSGDPGMNPKPLVEGPRSLISRSMVTDDALDR